MTANYYANLLKAWPKASGSKPTAEHFATVHAVGKKPGVEALHLAMCLRPEGCTVPQFTTAGSVLKGGKCGPANNTRKAYVNAGVFAQSIVPGSRPFAFTLALTAKGKALVKAGLAQAAAAAMKPEKAPEATKAPVKARKAPSKARTAPVKPTTAPVVPPVQVTAPVAVTAPTASH